MTVEFNETVKPLNQEDTFFIVSSKSFSTDETLQSMALSKAWLEAKCKFEDHFIALPHSQIKLKIWFQRKHY